MTYHDYYELSDLKVVGDAPCHPCADLAEQQIEDLCACFGIMLPGFTEYNSITASMLPHASLERLVPLGVLNNLLHYLNDIYNRHNRTEADAAIQARLRHVYRAGLQILITGDLPPHEHFFYDVMYYLHQEFKPYAQGPWLLRLVRTLTRHLNATTYNNSSIIVNDKVDVGHYIAVRSLDSRVHPMMDMVEFAGNFYLSERVLSEHHLKYMRNLCVKIGSLMNDLFSYEKDVIAQGSCFNLLVAYQESYEMSFEAAVHHSIEMLNEWTLSFLDVAHDIPRYGDARLDMEIDQYVQGLKDILSANWHWHMYSERFRTTTSPFKELRIPRSA